MADKWNKILESVSDQQWFIELKTKWDDLDPQSRMYLSRGALIGGVLLVFLCFAIASFNVSKTRADLKAKEDLITLIRTTSEEVSQLRQITSGLAASAGNEDWTPVFDQIASEAGLDKTLLTVSPEITPEGTKSEGSKKDKTPPKLVKESIFELTLKKINIKQMVKFAIQLEGFSKPIKVKSLNVTAHKDASGYLDAILEVSAFSLLN